MILKDPDGVPYPDEVQRAVRVLEVNDGTVGMQVLIAALESVRNAQQISMTDPRNVWYFKRDSPSLAFLVAELRFAEKAPWARLAVDLGALKVKSGEGSWSPPIYGDKKEE